MSRQMSKKRQDELIHRETARLEPLLELISEEKRELAVNLMDEIAFMRVTLFLLKERIQTQGATYEFKQGVQKMWVENPAQKSYNTMINRYTASLGKLSDLLPKEQNIVVSDGFDDFLERR